MSDWPRRPTEWRENGMLCVSVPFTWNLPDLRRRFLTLRELDPSLRVIVGGPAVRLMPSYLADLDFVTIGGDHPGVLQRVNPLATRTTTGCVRACPFCGVRQIEPNFSELADWPDLPVLADNNLLAASSVHFDRVMDRLERHGWADFTQGIDSRILNAHHAERFARLHDPRTKINLALDSLTYADQWENALDILKQAGVKKKRIYSYAIVGFKDTPEQAWRKCNFIKRKGVSVLAMRYHPLDTLGKNPVTQEMQDNGWTDAELKQLLGYYWRRRGTKPDYLEAA